MFPAFAALPTSMWVFPQVIQGRLGEWFMSDGCDGVSQRSQGIGSAKFDCPCMAGMSQGAREGGAIMSMDGRYFARSQGRRCNYVHGWTVFRKEPGKAVRLCPWMDGISQGAREGGAIMSSINNNNKNVSLYLPYSVFH